MSEGPVLFSYHPQQPFPNYVSLAGEFNSWSPTPLFYSDVSSRFETTVMLEDGKSYCYKFVIDGNWILAPNAEKVWENGIENSIIRVTSDKFVKSASEPEPGRAPDPEAPATELQVSVTESEASATEPEAPVIEAEASAAEPETPAKEQEPPVTEPETPDAGRELVSSCVITSEGYVLVQKANVELSKSDETAESVETKIEEEAAPIPPTVDEAAKYVEAKADEVAAAVKPKTEEDAAPLEADVVATAEETMSSITETLTKSVESAFATAAEMAGSAAMKVTENAEAVKEIAFNTISAGMETLNSTTIPDTDPNIAVGLPAVVPEVVNAASEPALTPCSEEAANAPDTSAAPSDMCSIERVVTANTTITTPELTTPVKEDVNKNYLPDAVPSPVLEASAEASAESLVPAETPSSATPAIPAEPSTGSPKEPAVAEAITAGDDTAISIPAETPAEPVSDPAPAGPAPAPAYETASKSKQPGLLAILYDIVSTSVLGKLFQYVFSIFNRSA
ncbi:hypothetical protein V1515DRAFT_579380 [Lipomyces mesembrius]